MTSEGHPKPDPVQLMVDDYARMWTLQIEYEKATHQAFFGFLTVSAAIAAIYAKEFGADKTGWFIFVLTQVEFMLSVFALGAGTSKQVYDSHAAALERKINAAIGKQALIFQSVVSPKFYNYGIGKQSSLLPWSLLPWSPLLAQRIIIICLALMFVIGITFACVSTPGLWWLLFVVVGGVEVVAVISFAALSTKLPKEVIEFSEGELLSVPDGNQSRPGLEVNASSGS